MRVKLSFVKYKFLQSFLFSIYANIITRFDCIRFAFKKKQTDLLRINPIDYEILKNYIN